MRKFAYIFIFVALINQLAFSQSNTNMQGSDSTLMHVHEIDTLFKIDALDSVYSREAKALHSIDSGVLVLNHCIDSLNRLDISLESYQKNLDSLYEGFNKRIIDPIQSGEDSVSARVKRKTKIIDERIKNKTAFLDSLQNVGVEHLDTNLNFDGEIPTALNSNPITQEIPSVRGFSVKQPTLTNTRSLTDISPSPKVNPQLDLGVDVGKIREVKDEVADYSAEVKRIKAGGLDSLQKVPEVIEQRALESDHLKPLKNGIAESDKLKGQVTEVTSVMSNPKEMEANAAKRTKKILVDHFADKQDVVKDGMEKLAKYQKKYYSLADSRNLPKRRTSSETSKPFVERLIPGINFQFDQDNTDWTRLNLSPYLGYRFSDRFRTAVGYTYRFSFNVEQLQYNSLDRASSLRLFSEYKIWGNIFFHLEGELTKYSIDNSKPIPILEDPEIQKSIYLGVVRIFTLSKKFDWNIQMLYSFKEIKEFTFQQMTFRTGIEYKITRRQVHSKS